MKRIGLALVLALTLTLLLGGAWASHGHHHGHHGFHGGCCVFVGPVGPVSPFFAHPFGLHRHFFFPPSSTCGCLGPGGGMAFSGSGDLAIGLSPVSRVLLRNPCD